MEINAASFIFVPMIEWKSRACILMPGSERQICGFVTTGSNKLTFVPLTVTPMHPPLTRTYSHYLHVLAVLVAPIRLQEKSRTSIGSRHTTLLKPSNPTLKALEAESQTSKPAESTESEGEGEEKYEEYEVEIEQPYGLKFAKGRDGAT
ncbi:hypothetical protein DKX38_000017 [Salix brachista]|uniref:Uncharacterized protein n=1 Tax=Salix brachista TaxID=2182728 RepID=A0A5N5P178_9ROSI|nr:hypothetical protein DKX38_000017 [Salix brachista]